MSKKRAPEKLLGPFTIRAYRMVDLAYYYEVDPDTVANWLAPFAAIIGEKRGQYYYPKQVETIIKSIGLPNKEISEQD